MAETKIDFEHLSVSEALKQLDVDLKIGDVGVADDRHVGQIRTRSGRTNNTFVMMGNCFGPDGRGAIVRK